MSRNEHLRKLATKVDILDGAVTLWFIPFATPYTQNILTSTREALGELGYEDSYRSIFILCEAFIVDAQFQKGGNAFVSAVRTWWEARDEPVLDRWTIFSTCLPFALMRVLYAAYEQSRQVLPQPSAELMEGPPDVVNDPLPESATENGGTPSVVRS